MAQPITITSMVTGKSVQFKAYITDMNQTFASTWNSVDVYGRNDSISTFQGTKRTISLTFDVPAGSEKEASENLAKCGELATYLYPGYARDGEMQGKGKNRKFIESSKTISRAPLVKIHFSNLIDSMVGKKPQTKKEKENKKKSTADTMGVNNALSAVSNATTFVADNLPKPKEKDEKEKKITGKKIIPGLLGFIDSYTFTPNMETGMFGRGPYYPRTINVSLTFNVLHQTELGFAHNEISPISKGKNEGKISYGEVGWIAGKLPFT